MVAKFPAAVHVLFAGALLVAGCADDEGPSLDAGGSALDRPPLDGLPLDGPPLDGPLDSAAEVALDASLDVSGDRTIYRSQEAQYCSTDASEDPYYECNLASSLVCASTHAERLQGGGGFVARFLCRLRCTPGDRCPVATDICCPGRDPSGGAVTVCVPEQFCQTIGPDAGAPG
jgi:hypothetical protein